MSTRAIASVTGASKNTITNDRREVSQVGTPAPSSDLPPFDPATGEVLETPAAEGAATPDDATSGQYLRHMGIGGIFAGLAVGYWLIVIAAALVIIAAMVFLVRALFGVTVHRAPTAEELDPEAFYDEDES